MATFVPWNQSSNPTTWPDLDLVGIALPFTTTATGELLVRMTWPLSVPPGFTTLYQFWMADPGVPGGWAASDGVLATSS